jgi:hypothetical protein
MPENVIYTMLQLKILLSFFFGKRVLFYVCMSVLMNHIKVHNGTTVSE